MNLSSQLARRGEDKRPGMSRLGSTDSGKAGEHGQAKSIGLARPGRAAAEYVFACKGVGNRGFLNRKRFGNAFVVQNVYQALGKAEIGKGSHRFSILSAAWRIAAFHEKDLLGKGERAPKGPNYVTANLVGLSQAAVTGPLNVEGAWLVGALEGVGAEEIALALNESGRQTLGTQAVVVGER